MPSLHSFFFLFFLQVFFYLIRSQGIILITKGKTSKAVVNSGLNQLLYLVSLAAGIGCFNAGDFVGVVGFILGGMLGTYLGMKITEGAE